MSFHRFNRQFLHGAPLLLLIRECAKERDQPAASCRPSSMHNCPHACSHGIRTPRESPWRSAPVSISESMSKIAQLSCCITVRICIKQRQTMSKFSDTADECAKVRTSFPVRPACIHERLHEQSIFGRVSIPENCLFINQYAFPWAIRRANSTRKQTLLRVAPQECVSKNNVLVRILTLLRWHFPYGCPCINQPADAWATIL